MRRVASAPQDRIAGQRNWRRHYAEGSSGAGAGTKAQRNFTVADRSTVAGPQPEDAINTPAVGEAWVERNGTIDQRHHRVDVFAKVSQWQGGIHRDARIVTGHFQGSPSEIDALPTIRRRIT
jgi:hypothetical protein